MISFWIPNIFAREGLLTPGGVAAAAFGAGVVRAFRAQASPISVSIQITAAKAAPSASADSLLNLSASVGKGGVNREADSLLVQRTLNRAGASPPLVEDGICGKKTIGAISLFQARAGVPVDGLIEPGGLTDIRLASAQSQPVKPGVAAGAAAELGKQDWPKDDDAALTAYFGEAGSNIVKMTLPYPMRLAWDTKTVVNTISVNAKVVDSLTRIFNAILKHYGSLEAVREARMDLYAGAFNKRRMTGNANRWSRHSWGIAIDIDSANNAFNAKWPGRATMPLEVVEIFEAEGWLSGARAWGKDAMHFQATK
jgi:peptidoglycan hydrolase-like protein with peptidoglycan-binding domain